MIFFDDVCSIQDSIIIFANEAANESTVDSCFADRLTMLMD